MSQIFNEKPTPPEFIEKTQAATTAAAKLLGCGVLLVAVQEGENGKVAVAVDGFPEHGDLAKVAKDPSQLLMTLSWMAKVQTLMQPLPTED
jgi:hypothetical protein